MKKVLIFGGSGQIGRHLIRRLTKKNHLVTVVTRNLHKKGAILKTQGNPGYIEVIEANVFDENQLNKLFNSFSLKTFASTTSTYPGLPWVFSIIPFLCKFLVTTVTK